MDPFTDMMQAFLATTHIVSAHELVLWLQEWLTITTNANALVCRASEVGTAACAQAWDVLTRLRRLPDGAQYPYFIDALQAFSCYHYHAADTIRCTVEFPRDPGLSGLQAWVRDWLANGAQQSLICGPAASFEKVLTALV